MIYGYKNDINMVKDYEVNIENIYNTVRKNIKIIEAQIKEKEKEKKHKKTMASTFKNKSFTFGEYEKWRKLNNK
tara:strand:- start:431 stop:652 length:222 start_codon:yes stop_codon:yes gene_type:complete